MNRLVRGMKIYVYTFTRLKLNRKLFPFTFSLKNSIKKSIATKKQIVIFPRNFDCISRNVLQLRIDFIFLVSNL